jgi:shikimate kinase
MHYPAPVASGTGQGSAPIATGGVTRVALIGFMGAGKSSVGMALAVALRWRFVDLDRTIEQEQGRTIREIFAAAGESGFRAAESAALHRLTGAEQTVLAVGGGAPVQPANRAFFRDWMTFYLAAPLAELRERAGRPGARPLMDLPPAQLRALYQRREPIYQSLGIRIHTTRKPVGAIVAAILERMRQPV